MNINKLRILLAQATALAAIAPRQERTVAGEVIHPKEIIGSLVDTVEQFIAANAQLPESDSDMLERMGTDAMLWTEEFAKRNPKVSGKMTDNLFGWFANAIEAGRRAGQPQTEAVQPDTDDLKKDATGATEGCQCPVCRIKRMLSEVKSGIDNDQQKRMSKDFWEMIEGLGEKNISDGLITLVGEDAETFYRTGKLPDNILKEMQSGGKLEKTTKH